MSNYTTAAFWQATAERAVRSAAQSIIGLIGVDQVGIVALDWGHILSITATMTVLSVLTSLVGGTNGPGPSLTSAEITPRTGSLDLANAEEVEVDDAEDTPLDQEADTDDEATEELDDIETTKADEQAALDENLTDETPVDDNYEPRH